MHRTVNRQSERVLRLANTLTWKSKLICLHQVSNKRGTLLSTVKTCLLVLIHLLKLPISVKKLFNLKYMSRAIITQELQKSGSTV